LCVIFIVLQELRQLAKELREEIIFSVAETGGHLSASLGVVDLTVALHYVFNTLHDKIVWDVGHQSYPHKILTGRRSKMGTMRQTSGLAGFPRRVKREHDAFGAGHSSTNISVAVGMLPPLVHYEGTYTFHFSSKILQGFVSYKLLFFPILLIMDKNASATTSCLWILVIFGDFQWAYSDEFFDGPFPIFWISC
jgi:hypothetical protein